MYQSLSLLCDSDDDESNFECGLFENGYWIWSDLDECLEFISYDLSIKYDDDNYKKPLIEEKIIFKTELELIEQLTFRRRHMRKIAEGEPNVITLQDVIDVVLFTIPKVSMPLSLVFVLHSASCERLLRSLIVYTQYFIQVSQLMKFRAYESKYKIRQAISEKIENTLRDDLSELRAIVAHETSAMKADFQKRDKMANFIKNIESDCRRYEIFLRIIVQIVWIALSRPKFDIIDVEINRIFRTNAFNFALRKTEKIASKRKSQIEKNVLYAENRNEKLSGACYCRENDARQKFHRISPMTCDLLTFVKDYRTVGIGSMGFQSDTSSVRMDYLEMILCAPEEYLVNTAQIKVGILGQPRNNYDLLLVEIKVQKDKQRPSILSPGLKSSKSSFSSKRSFGLSMMFRDSLHFTFPQVCDEKEIPQEFYRLPKRYVRRKSSSGRLRRWLKRFKATQKSSYSLFTGQSSGNL